MGLESNYDLMRSLAWKYHRWTGVEFQELFQEACLAYLESMKSYNPELSILERTYAWNCARNALGNFCAKEVLRSNRKISIDTCNTLSNSMLSIENLLEYFSGDGKIIVNCILNEKYRGTLSPTKIKILIRKRLIRRGWSYERVKQAMEEARQAFQRYEHLTTIL